MTVDTTTLRAQIDQLAKAIDDTTAAELEACLEHAFAGDEFDIELGPAMASDVLRTEVDYREGFLAGMVWAIVLHRRGATMLGLMRLPNAEVLRQAADIFDRHHPDDADGISHSLMCLARNYHDGLCQDGE